MQSPVCGMDYNALVGLNPSRAIDELLCSLSQCGLQATNLARAREVVQSALQEKRGLPSRGTLAVSYTSNLISCGLRETFAFLAKEKLVDCFVTTAGGIEEDIIKCLGKTVIGDFALNGKDLRLKGLNRVGNLLVPNDNYCAFENFFVPVIKSLHEKQRACRWERFTTPTEIIHATGEAMASLPNCEESVVYWCYKNNIPMHCPALTDGSMGDMIYFYNFSKKGLVVDPIPDRKVLRQFFEVRRDEELTALVLGGGLPKHQLLSCLQGGTDKQKRRVVMVSTGLEADGCVSSSSIGDDTREGLLQADDHVVRIHADATVVMPLLL